MCERTGTEENFSKAEPEGSRAEGIPASLDWGRFGITEGNEEQALGYSTTCPGFGGTEINAEVSAFSSWFKQPENKPWQS